MSSQRAHPAASSRPRLRFGVVLLRGALYGLAAVPLAGLLMLGVAGHETRLTFLAVTAGISLAAAVAWLPMGAFFWLCCRGDIRRWRDWRSVRGRFDGVCIAGPAMVRVGALGLTLGGCAWLLYQAVDAAGYATWLYGR
jgi:hypothetical protein